jgi:ribose transport system ATP-binding protein
MPEMITLADRIVVMNDYLVMGELPNTRDYTEMSEGIMQLIHDAEETAESFVQVTS